MHNFLIILAILACGFILTMVLAFVQAGSRADQASDDAWDKLAQGDRPHLPAEMIGFLHSAGVDRG